jgi:hypothetical protein
MNSQSDTVTSLDAASFALARTLPREIICIILEHYLEARAQSLVAEKGQRLPHIQYPVLPIMLTCKWFSQATIPLLYRHVILTGSNSAHSFLLEANRWSYSHVKRIDMNGPRWKQSGALKCRVE